MRTSTLFSAAAALLSIGSVSAVSSYCTSTEISMCCQNMQEPDVGYYCATPDQDHPCYIGSPQMSEMCCTGSDLTPRGYVGLGCRRVTVTASSAEPTSTATIDTTVTAASPTAVSSAVEASSTDSVSAAEASSTGSVSAASPYCTSTEISMCCQNLQEPDVGYYCATPNQAHPCYIGSPQMSEMCCTGTDLTPRGYVGLGCRRVTVASPTAVSSAVEASSTVAAVSSPAVVSSAVASSASSAVAAETTVVSHPQKVCKKKTQKRKL